DAKRGERGGRVTGELTGAKTEAERRRCEMQDAKAADETLTRLRREVDRHKRRRDDMKKQVDAAGTEVEQLAGHETLLEAALHDAAILSSFETTQEEWDGLDEELKESRKDLESLQGELQQLATEYRVARHQELSHQIEQLRANVVAAAALAEECAVLEA